MNKIILKIKTKFSLILIVMIFSSSFTIANTSTEIDIKYFTNLVIGSDAEQQKSLTIISQKWNKEFSANYTVMILESMSFVRNREMYMSLNKLIQNKTGENFAFDSNAWFNWVWSKPFKPHSQYAKFKSDIYQIVDPIFSEYFDNKPKSTIRLDEVRWGGVRQDGIPPLRQPKMVLAPKADYLNDSDIVFGIEINNDVRAYPKRILAWHEMFVDKVGGIQVAGVYCTLCGTVIIYDTKINNKNYNIGTSGFLYRSNKMMYDKKTQSLWSTFSGKPVVGPLVAKDIKLPHRYVVTTTWAEWKKRHPRTQVLSLNTGYKRNYNEGVAYRDYFSTDKLMFTVPKLDSRLKNKDQILGLLFNKSPNKPLAISVKFLAKNPIYHDKIQQQGFVALTDNSGAIRVYEDKGLKFVNWDQNNIVTDKYGIKWKLTESKLTNTSGDILYRLPANRAFWFGWYSAYSHTRLVF